MPQYPDVDYTWSNHIKIINFKPSDPDPSLDLIVHQPLRFILGSDQTKHHKPIICILDLTLHQILNSCSLGLMTYMCNWTRQVHIPTFIWDSFHLYKRSIIMSLSFFMSFRFTVPFVVPFLSAFLAHQLYRFSWKFTYPSRFISPTQWLTFFSILGPSLYRQGITILALHIFSFHLLCQQGWDYFIKLQGSCIATYCNN